MRAIDTNIVLRFILEDDPRQATLARYALAAPCLIGLSVLMEAAWVLGSTYRMPRETIAAALTTVIDLTSVRVPDDAGVRWAIERYRSHNADLADMLHIVAAKGASSFASFEKRLASQAGADTPVPIERLA